MQLIKQEHIDNFSPRLKEILNEEIKMGNKIYETAFGWPYSNAIFIYLYKGFLGTYSIPDVKFEEINDAHFWKSQYHDTRINDILACMFDY